MRDEHKHVALRKYPVIAGDYKQHQMSCRLMHVDTSDTLVIRGTLAEWDARRGNGGSYPGSSTA